MVDIFALTVPHVALLIALWRLVQRDDLDREGGAEPPRTRPGREPPRA